MWVESKKGFYSMSSIERTIRSSSITPEHLYLGKASHRILNKEDRHCMDEIRERKNWWEICDKLQIGIGGNMMKLRRKPVPSPFIPSHLPH